MERIEKKVGMLLWGGFGLVAFVGVLCGAWWQLGAVVLCGVMVWATSKEEVE